MSLSDDMLNKFVAPGISELKSDAVPDIQSRFPHAKNWIDFFLLNTFIGATVVGTTRPVVLNFLRRVESALMEYMEARTNLNTYIKGSKQAVRMYFLALNHFEHAIAMTYQASMLMHNFYPGEIFFELNDGSPIQRLNELYNYTKHIDKKLDSGKLSDGFSIPMWISNTGLHCSVCVLTFTELINIFDILAANADKLYVPSSI